MNLENETYKPGGLLLTWVTGLLAAGAILGVVSFFSDLLQKQLLDRYAAIEKRDANLDVRFFTEEEAESRTRGQEEALAKLAVEGEQNDARQALIGFLEIGLYLVTAVFFLRLLSRANRNARAMGALGMEFTPGWCIGWFFVPIANLFKPFQAVRETWKASIASETPWQNNDSSWLLGTWWTLWIGSGFLGQAVFRSSLRAESIPELQDSTDLSLVADAVGVLLTIVALLVIRRLYWLQDEKYQLVGVAGPMCGEPLSRTPAAESER
jgi:hypothetical protein